MFTRLHGTDVLCCPKSLEFVMRDTCSCVEDVRCGACMTGAVDPVAGLSTPPADDVREALMSVHYCPEHGDLLAPLDGRDTRSIRCVEAHTIEQILGSVRPRGTVTDAEALRFGKVAWVAYQDDKSWAESVVEDCFSPADDLPEEALDMIAVARAVLEADRGVRS